MIEKLGTRSKPVPSGTALCRTALYLPAGDIKTEKEVLRLNLYRRMLTSYLLVCLIPLLLSLFTTIKLEQNVRDSLLADRDNVSENIQREIDLKLDDAITTASVLASDTMIGQLGTQYAFSRTDSIEQNALIDTLAPARVQHQAVNFVFCYFQRSGHIVSDERAYSRGAADLFAKRLEIPYETLMEALQNPSVTYSVQPVTTTGTPYLLVTYNQFTSDYEERLSCVGLLLRIPHNLVQWDEETTEVFLSFDGEVIYGSGLASEALQQLGSGSPAGGTIDLGGGKYVYSLRQSEICGLSYGLLTKQSEYYQGVRMLVVQIVLEIAIYILFGVLVSVFISRRTFSPFKRILDFVGTRCAENADQTSFEGVQRALQSLADKKDSLENQMRQIDRQTRTRYISRYLLGFSSDSSALSQYIEDGQPYRLVLFSLIHPEKSEFFKNVPQDHFAATQEMLYFAIRNILEEIFLENRGGVSMMADDCVVLALQDEPALTREEAEQALKTASEALSLPIACYIGPVRYHLSEGPGAWKQVQQLYRETGFWQKDRKPGVWMVTEQPDTGSPDSYPAHIPSFSEALGAGDYPKAEEILQSILREDLGNGRISSETARYRLAGLADLLSAYLPADGGDWPRKMVEPGTPEEKRQLLLEKFHQLTESASEAETASAEDKHTQWAESVRQYIEENYQNSSLSVSMVADHLQISLSTLSRRYKNAAGQGVLDEIHPTRPQNAKRLLQSGKTVRETAEQTGYIESRAMIRAFKRYEGMTPGQYAGKE